MNPESLKIAGQMVEAIRNLHNTGGKEEIEFELAKLIDLANSAEKTIERSKKIEDALKNMMGAFDTPLARRRMSGEFCEEARESAREALGIS